MTQRAIDGEHLYFVTANVQDRRWFFVTPERADALGRGIRRCCQMKDFDLLAYCILPNHFHLLVRKLTADEVVAQKQTQRTLGSVRCGTGERTESEAGNRLTRTNFLFLHRRLPSRRSLSKRFTLSDLMHSIKSTYSQTLRRGKFWQHRSNFRIIDNQAYLYNVAEYIQGNYVKMNLPAKYGRAPFVYVNLQAFERLEK